MTQAQQTHATVTPENADELQPFGLIKTVFSYTPAEVRAAFQNSKLTREIADTLLHSVRPARSSNEFANRFIGDPSDYGLDNLERDLVERGIPEFLKHHVSGLDTFPSRYWTAGAHEGIFHAMVQLRNKGIKRIFTLAGDYEGFKHCAQQAGLEHKESLYSEAEKARPNVRDFWFISQPNAIDGNFLNEMFWQKFLTKGHKIFLDISYLPAALPRAFVVNQESIKYVAVSFSKPFGTFYSRMGMLYAKEEVESLIGNKWFKNVDSILKAEYLTTHIRLGDYLKEMKARQYAACDSIKALHEVELTPSDAFLLAYADIALATDHPELWAFQRHSRVRACLTAQFLRQDMEDPQRRWS